MAAGEREGVGEGEEELEERVAAGGGGLQGAAGGGGLLGAALPLRAPRPPHQVLPVLASETGGSSIRQRDRVEEQLGGTLSGDEGGFLE